MVTPAGTLTVFRPHRIDPARLAQMHGIYADLNREWVRTCELPTSGLALIRWTRRQPALSGIASLPDLLDAIDTGAPARTDELLLALVQLAQDGQQLAGRTVLQAMLPKLTRMARRTAGSSSDDWDLLDRQQIGVAEFWDVLMAYPVDRRPHKIAANLALDTLNRLTAATRAGATERVVDPQDGTFEKHIGHVTAPEFTDPTSSQAQLPGSEPHADADLLEVLAWALEENVVRPQDAAILVRVYAPADGERNTSETIAEELGITPQAVRQRCSRARRALIRAVHAHTTRPLSDRPAHAEVDGTTDPSGLPTLQTPPSA